MASPLYELQPRRLSGDDLESLVPAFSCGKEWWEREVNDFLHRMAWEGQQRGDSLTTIFSTSDRKDIAGFITTVTIGLRTKDLKEALGYTDWAETDRSTVPSTHIIYFGVHQPYQGRAYGTEILMQLFEALAADTPDLLHRPRFIHLDVWKQNSRAAKFYKDIGFELLSERSAALPYADGRAPLLRMLLNREELKGK